MNISLTAVLVLTPLTQALAGTPGKALPPNPSFERGQDAPDGWKLEGGRGGWAQNAHTGRRSVSVTGNGRDSSYWRCTDLKLAPRTVYRISTHLKTSPGTAGGCLIVGPSSNNRDYQTSENWVQRGFVFVTPDRTDDVFLRVGQWQVPGTVFYDDVRLYPVMPLYANAAGVVLGEGERIAGGRYIAAPPLEGEGSNQFRGLVSHTAGFNSHRWVFGPGRSVTYAFQIDGVAQTAGKIAVTIGHYTSGTLHVEAGKDGQGWTPVGELRGTSSKELTVPASLYPADKLWVRLRASGGPEIKGDSAPGNLQVYSLRYEADLDRKLPDAAGSTNYLEIISQSPDLRVTIESIARPGSARPAVTGQIRSTKDNPALSLRLTLAKDGKRVVDVTRRLRLEAGKAVPFEVPYALRSPGTYDLTLAAGDLRGQSPFSATTTLSLPVLLAADYGDLIRSDPRGELWWCGGTHKVSRHRPAPEGQGKPVRIVIAGNEHEPFQLVLRPKVDLKGVRASVSDLTGPGGRIDRKHVDVYRVAWVHVSSPTDRVGCVGDWPDPLPRWDKPFDVPGGTNQPIWINVYVPTGTKPGDYKGTATIQADGGVRYDVPVSLRVLGFALPKEAHVFATFGFSPGNVRKYHNLETNDELRRVYELYLENFAAHRISPYDPMMLDPIKVSVETGLGWKGGRRVTEQPAAGARSLKIVDDSTKGDVSARTIAPIPIDPQAAYTLRWKVKTAKADQPAMVTLMHYDHAGQWIYGRNHDIVVTGSGRWDAHERTLKGISPGNARSVQIVLRPTRWTELAEGTGTAWFDDVSLRREDDDRELVTDSGFEVDHQRLDVKVDFTAFDRAAKRYLDGYGFTAFRLPVKGMGWGTFHDRGKGSIGGFEQGTPEYDVLMKKYLGQVEAHLREKGWLRKAYIYWFDEPNPKDYEFVKEGMAVLKRSAPGLTRMLTEQPEEAMYGSVDLWCPLTASYSEKICRQRQALGERVMWYVCCGPREPYATLFIDHPAIDFRMWLWQTYKYDVEGILIWATNYWTSGCAYPEPNYQNPWQDPMSWVSGYSTPVGTRRAWGNGDGRFLYPPNTQGAADKTTKYLCGPVSSIRWEILRDGIEDFEYLWQLRHAVRTLRKRGVSGPDLDRAERLTVVPETICKTLTDFTWDPTPLYAHREQVGLALEKLLAKHKLTICAKPR